MSTTEQILPLQSGAEKAVRDQLILIYPDSKKNIAWK